MWVSKRFSDPGQVATVRAELSRSSTDSGRREMSAYFAGPELFPMPKPQGPPLTPGYRTTGIIPSQGIRELIRSEEVTSLSPIAPDQVQPASIDLRLGARAYRVQASFLPGP